MNLLLDTHAFIWFAEGDSRLSKQAQEIIADPANRVYVSAGTLWEIAIKISLGRLKLAQPFDE